MAIAAREHLQAQNPMVLWLVPSTAILNQTLDALKNLEHPYRAALAKDFGRNLSVMSLVEALSMSRPDAEGGTCIIVSTLQAFRVEDAANRKVYEDAGNLMAHFSGLAPEQLARLEKVEGTERPIASLCNLLRLHRPMVIVDEAHNVRTPLSFETLTRADRNLMQLAFDRVPGAGKVIDKLFIQSNRIQASELKEGEERPPFIVPMLGFRYQGELELFRKEHFLDLPWNLAECNASGFADKFVIRDTSKEGIIDVSEKGKVEIAFSAALHQQTSMVIHEPEWTMARLVNWLDRGIPHRDVTKPSAKVFIQNAVEGVMAKRG